MIRVDNDRVPCIVQSISFDQSGAIAYELKYNKAYIPKINGKKSGRFKLDLSGVNEIFIPPFLRWRNYVYIKIFNGDTIQVQYHDLPMEPLNDPSGDKFFSVVERWAIAQFKKQRLL